MNLTLIQFVSMTAIAFLHLFITCYLPNTCAISPVGPPTGLPVRAYLNRKNTSSFDHPRSLFS